MRTSRLLKILSPSTRTYATKSHSVQAVEIANTIAEDTPAVKDIPGQFRTKDASVITTPPEEDVWYEQLGIEDDHQLIKMSKPTRYLD